MALGGHQALTAVLFSKVRVKQLETGTAPALRLCRALQNAVTVRNKKPNFPQNEGHMMIPTLPYHHCLCRNTCTSSAADCQGENKPSSHTSFQRKAASITYTCTEQVEGDGSAQIGHRAQPEGEGSCVWLHVGV